MQQKGSKFNLVYSTPSCYLKALRDANETWPVKTDDFFPYASDPTAVWTGYFTSRPTVKRYERMGNHFLQICKQLTSLAFLKGIDRLHDRQKMNSRLTHLREEMGVLQHHDAVTGTEKQHVADDYIKNAYKALEGCNENARTIFNELVQPTEDRFEGSGQPVSDPPRTNFEFESCHYLNISQCRISESSQNFMVTVYNPLAHSTFQPVRIPVRHPNYRVRDYRQVPVEIQILPINERIAQIPYRNSVAEYEIVFLAQEIPGLGYKSYYVEAYDVAEEVSRNSLKWRQEDLATVEIGNKNVRAKFDTISGLLKSVTVNGESHDVTQEFMLYNGALGHNYNQGARSSGAYIFRPNGTHIVVADTVEINVVRGDVVDEVHQRFNEWISQVVKIYHDNSTGVEFEWTVGPIPVDDLVGKEIVTRFTGGIRNEGIFHTDSNGREMILRRRNLQPMYQEEVIAQNYYPINSKIFIEDHAKRMAILTDRAQGATSMEDGSIDVMVHRRLLADDAFGVGEALNEKQYGSGLIANGKLLMLFSSKSEETSVSTERFAQNRILMPNWIFFSTVVDSYEDWLRKYKNIVSIQLWADNLMTFNSRYFMAISRDPT